MLERQRPRFSVVKFTVELLSTVILVLLVFVAKWINSPINGEPVSLFEYILDLIPYMARA